MGISEIERHSRDCSICSHKEREQIELEFVAWESPTRLSRRFHISRRSVYRHASALDLFEKRSSNVRSALEKIIERGCETQIGARGLVAAVEAYSKINSQGKWVDRRELVNLNDLFDKMSEDELESYARDGKLPAWFELAIGRTLAPSTENPEA
jgi:hypothetical protein